MSIISKIIEALTVLNTVVAFAEKVKVILGVTDGDDLTATQEALGDAAND